MTRGNAAPRVTEHDIFHALRACIDSCSRDFENLSRELVGAGEKTSKYLDYCHLNLSDEDKLIKPKLIRSFLRDVLQFKDSDFIPEIGNRNGRRPDITFADQSLHPFAFEIKGMDSDDEDLHDEWVDKGTLYIEDDPNLRFLVITNMREFRVYGAHSGEDDRFSLLNNLCFDMPDVYRWAKDNDRHDGSDLPAFISAFKSFCNIFCCKTGSLTLDQKIEEIFQAPPDRPWKTKSEKEREAEKKNIRNDLFSIIESFVDDLKTNHKMTLLSVYESDSESQLKLEKEIGEISCSLGGHVANFVSQDELVEKGKNTLKEYFDEGLLFSDEMDLYYRRVAYFTVFKLLLIRAWEDAEFISREEWTLYDGGFQRWYNQSNKNIKRVLESAYGIAKNRYEWLFKDNNNYSWYYPSDEFAIDALWRLSRHNFAMLNNDVLGSIYEEHLNLSAKKKIGLFYTHPKIVSLMWDVVGFNDEDSIFELSAAGKKVESKLKRIFDPCMGSGSFLCEAIRRILDVSGIYDGKHGDLKSLRRLKDQMLGGMRGVELDQFAFFIAEINVLLMLTPLVKLIEDKGRGGGPRETFATGLIPHDSLYFYRSDEPGWELDEESEAAPKGKDYSGSNDALIFGRKRDVAKELYSGMTAGEEFGFEYCASNPPYVGEKEAKDLFDSVKAANPHLEDIYQGKMDYLYWFIMLGLSKLKSGGKLCYITTAYWPTADGAKTLRDVMLRNGIIRTIIDFGEQKLFEHAPGQHNLVFVIEKSDARKVDPQSWRDIRPKVVEVKVGAKIEGDSHEQRLDRLVGAISENFHKGTYEDDLLRIYESGKCHGDLETKSWNLKCTIDEVTLITKLHKEHSSLKQEFCAPKQGIVPGALTVTPKIKKKYFASNPKIREGEGIFTLTNDEAKALGKEGRQFLKPITKSSDILGFVNSAKDDLLLLYTHKENSPESCASVMNHLKKYKPLLENKRETKKGTLSWWSNHWPRDPKTFEMPNVIVPYRAIWNNCVAVDAPIYGLTEVYFIPDKSIEKLKALESILNSELAHFWFAIEGKQKGAQIELLDFDHFPMPHLEKENIKRLVKAGEVCRKAFSEIVDFGVCPRTAIHFGLDRSLFNPITLLKSDISTLKRFQTAGIKVEIKDVNDSATMKSVKVGEDDTRVAFTGKGARVTLNRGTLSASDFKMVGEWIERYGQGKTWREIYTELPFPKSAKALEVLELSFMKKLESGVKEAAKSYDELNEVVADCYGLNQKERKIVAKRVKIRIDDLKATDADVSVEDQPEEDIA